MGPLLGKVLPASLVRLKNDGVYPSMLCTAYSAGYKFPSQHALGGKQCLEQVLESEGAEERRDPCGFLPGTYLVHS